MGMFFTLLNGFWLYGLNFCKTSLAGTMLHFSRIYGHNFSAFPESISMLSINFPDVWVAFAGSEWRNPIP